MSGVSRDHPWQKNNGLFIDFDNYVFDFGRYCGGRPIDILEINPQFIQWFHYCVHWFSLSRNDYVRVMIEIIRQERRLAAASIPTP